MPTAACALNHAEHMESLALALPLISRQSTSSYNVTQIVASLPAECAPACTPTFTTLGYCEAGDADRCRQICAVSSEVPSYAQLYARAAPGWECATRLSNAHTQPANITALDACFDCFTKAFPLDEDTKAKLAANIAALKAGCSGSAANATSPAPSVEPTTGADDTNTTSAAK